MREIKFPLSAPKQRLLDAAEQLFAERGFEAVSVRDITGKAEANVAAINYHFGTREALIALTVTYRMGPVIKERLARLEAVEKKWAGKAAPLEEILDAMVRPLAGNFRKSDLGEPQRCQILGRILAGQGVIFPHEVEQDMENARQRLTRLLAKALPSVSSEDLAWRIQFVNGGIIHLLMDHGSTLGEEGIPQPLESTLSRFIRFAAAGLREGMPQETPAQKGPQATFDF
jgi:AcrR family transcriptional regulator